ncbi:putative c2h2 transcription protein [Botrytis fragariae]|uniref:Putative c2h2 transcription protein n=1 Tax=Botrytis fragariae TaxID=1964551 RepID=A0A8H6AUD2_9HELO|nr:putative c2h2 transcription protein [Botrytis fragariae]KAF5873817.1 putative c2h2 transcription protein [Botrytis fragariae]
MDSQLREDGQATGDSQGNGNGIGSLEVEFSVAVEIRSKENLRGSQGSDARAANKLLGDDALRRHELVHKKAKRSLLGRGARACSACAIARRRCSGGNPCEACAKRSIECTFPSSSGAMANEKRRESNELYEKVSNERVWVENGRTGEGITSPQSPISWSHVDSPLNTQMNPRSSISNYRSEFGMENLDVTGQQMNIQIMNSGVHQPFSQFSPSNHRMPEDARVNSTTSPNDQSTSPSMLPLHSIMDLDGAANSLLIGTSQASQQLHIQDTGLSEGLPESAGSWAQYNVSSINWLPYDWAPDYQLDDDAVRMIDVRTDLNGSSPITVPGESIRRPAYSTSTAIFTPSPQAQAQLHINTSPNPTISSEGAPKSPNSLTTQSTGRYYVDGHGSRLPRIRKAPSETANSCPSISHPSIEDLNGRFAFPVDDTNVHSSDYRQLPHEIYSIIQDVFEKTCIEDSPYFTPFQYTRFPSLYTLSRFIGHYIDSFHQTLPFIHLPSFNISASHWLFLLAMAAVGSHYHGNGSHAKPMHEFLRRATMSVSNDGDPRCTKIMMIQIKLLNCVGMMYCGSDELSHAAKSYHRDLNDFCCNEWKTSNQIPRIAVSQTSTNDTEQANREWKKWYDAESIRRTGYCIWLLDSMWYFHFQIRPGLSLDDSSVSLPCQEVLWEAESAIAWQQLLSCSSSSSTLHNTLQRMYTEKRLLSSTGEFSRILLIHGLFRRTWEVSNYLSQLLTQWTPTASKLSFPHTTSNHPIWLPGIQTYTNWRNSACDCLDILHWHANSVIGAASGMEHPTVLHLHLARVVLLTPFLHILKLAEYLATSHTARIPHLGDTDQENEKEILQARDYVKRWATEDQHKARLAIIHAGALFWHVRRFSIDAFYEAEAVYLATLALWAYGLFAECKGGVYRSQGDGEKYSNARDTCDNGDGRKSKEREREEEEEEEEEQFYNPYPSTMQLDRPADDELVQLFVKRDRG